VIFLFDKSLVLQKLNEVLNSKQILVDEPMSKHSTFKIGGNADFFVMPSSIEEVQSIFKISGECDVPVTVLGNGSNILVSDNGIAGIVCSFASPFSYIKPQNDKVAVGAGTILGAVSKWAGENSLTGMEFAVGIPGSVGGAVFMNAGAYDGEMKNVVTGVTAVSLDGKIFHYDANQLGFAYRHSIFQDNNQIICEIELYLKKGNQEEISSKMKDFTQRRIQKQPLEFPSAGSTFKRPEGYFAGTLIEQTGLKGFRIGGAEVSPKHAGFVVNTDHATAADVLELIHEVQRRVNEKHHVMLQPEVRMIGKFN
jgi:UDP-N-acetylmuramate dehydrogenase